MHAFIPPSPFLGVRPVPFQSRCRPVLSASASSDVVIIGAGVAGLSTAYELVQKGASVLVLTSPSRKPAAKSSAGMLAPDAEGLSGDIGRLSRVSHEMYPNFVRRLEQLVDIDLHYVARNDFLVTSKIPLSGPNVLTEEALRRVEPTLGPKVKAARRSIGDSSVDSRRLMTALHEACITLGVKIEQDEVHSVVVAPDAQSVLAVQTKTRRIVGGHYLIASGAWTSKLLPDIPIRPVKGQMLSLAPPESDSLRLNHVIYGPDVYIVPKNGGNEFYVGATVEHAGFDSKVRAGGISQLLNAVVEIVPNFAEYEIVETWAGLRPATPDLLPILGHSEYRNVTIASGYYRNGILLAPTTSSIAAASVLGEVAQLPDRLRDLANKFSYNRLLSVEGRREGQEDIDKPTLRSSRYESLPTKPTGASMGSTKTDGTVKLWKVKKDGTKEPVYPSKRFLRNREEQDSSTSETASDKESSSLVSESLMHHPQQSTSSDDGVYQGGEGFESHVENLENISGENDAYEDVLQKRHIADEVMSRALAANRAFGRKRSSLETDGSVPLSISEEEVMVYDAALQQGFEDMRQFEKHFDPNDPSVLATRAQEKVMELEAGDVSLSVNGVAVPSVPEGQDSSPASESSSGYF